MARNRNAGKGKNKRKGSNLATGRDYTYDKAYQKGKKASENKTMRTLARRKAIAEGRVKEGDTTRDVHHVSKPGSRITKRTKTRVMASSKNRGKKR